MAGWWSDPWLLPGGEAEEAEPGEGVCREAATAAMGTVAGAGYPTGAFGSATKIIPVPRHPVPPEGGAAAHINLGLEQASQALQQEKDRKVTKVRRGKGTRFPHPATQDDRDSPVGGSDAVATVPEAGAPLVARDAHARLGVTDISSGDMGLLHASPQQRRERMTQGAMGAQLPPMQRAQQLVLVILWLAPG